MINELPAKWGNAVVLRLHICRWTVGDALTQ